MNGQRVASGLRPLVRRIAVGAITAVLAVSASLPMAMAGAASHDVARVFFIAGFASALDADLGRLDDHFSVPGVRGEVYVPLLWRRAARDAAAVYEESGGTTRIILIGHSMGGQKVYKAAQYLNERGVPVALVIAFDPARGSEVPANVAASVNYYLEPNLSPVTPGPGFHGRLDNSIVGSEAEMEHRELIYYEAVLTAALSEIRRALR